MVCDNEAAAQETVSLTEYKKLESRKAWRLRWEQGGLLHFVLLQPLLQNLPREARYDWDVVHGIFDRMRERPGFSSFDRFESQFSNRLTVHAQANCTVRRLMLRNICNDIVQLHELAHAHQAAGQCQIRIRQICGRARVHIVQH